MECKRFLHRRPFGMNCKLFLLRRQLYEMSSPVIRGKEKYFKTASVEIFTQHDIGIKHGFSCINIRQVPWEVLKTEAEGRGFQHLPRGLANVNA